MKHIYIRPWAYIAIVMVVTAGLGYLLDFGISHKHQFAGEDYIHRYGFIALFFLMPILTFPLGSLGVLFAWPLVSTGILPPLDAFVLTSPVFAALGWLQWYVLLPKWFGRQNSHASYVGNAKLLAAHLCLPGLIAVGATAVGLTREPFSTDVLLAYLMGGFMFYAGPHFLWALVASLGKFSKSIWHSGLVASSFALLATSAFWLGPQDSSGLPIQWTLYWPLALLLMVVFPCTVWFAVRKKWGRPEGFAYQSQLPPTPLEK